jgi:hypothetical protein
MCWTCSLTVSVLIPKVLAICLLVAPLTISRSTSASRKVKETSTSAVVRGVAKAPDTRRKPSRVPLSKKEREQLPPPGRGCRSPEHRFEFTFDDKAAELDAQYDGYSAMVTTAPREQSADLTFTKYKQQCYSELANHEFKTPLAVHPLFLKSPERVEALVFLMLIALTTYFLLQRMYRQTVPADASARERRTTTQTLLGAFKRYMLIVNRTRLGREVQPTRLSSRQREILQRLGFDTPAQVLSRQLPRAP